MSKSPSRDRKLAHGPGRRISRYDHTFLARDLELQVEAKKGDVPAERVLGLRQDADFGLVTILWANVGVNVILALVSGSILTGVTAFLFSTVVITVFAEINPQAYFSRNALKLASLLSPVLRLYQVVLYPVPAAQEQVSSGEGRRAF